MRELIQVDEAGPRQHVLDADAAEDACELAHQVELARRAGGEVGVPALRLAGNEAAVHVEQQRLAEPGARGDDGRVAVRKRDALLQDRQLVGLEHVDPVGERFEIVQHTRAAEAERSPTAAPSTRHGTFVMRATWSVTAPATPKHAASIRRGSTRRDSRNASIIGSRPS